MTRLNPQECELVPSIFEPLSNIKDTSKHFSTQCRILLLTSFCKSYSCGYYSYQKPQSQISCTQEIAPSRTQPSSVRKGENINSITEKKKKQQQTQPTVFSMFSLNGFPRVRTMLLQNGFLWHFNAKWFCTVNIWSQGDSSNIYLKLRSWSIHFQAS